MTHTLVSLSKAVVPGHSDKPSRNVPRTRPTRRPPWDTGHHCWPEELLQDEVLASSVLIDNPTQVNHWEDRLRELAIHSRFLTLSTSGPFELGEPSCVSWNAYQPPGTTPTTCASPPSPVPQPKLCPDVAKYEGWGWWRTTTLISILRKGAINVTVRGLLQW